MSVVVIQIGQCGNQLGLALFNLIHNSLEHRGLDPKSARYIRNTFFRTTSPLALLTSSSKTSSNSKTSASTRPVARAILVDTEAKVIREALKECEAKKTGWRYDAKNVVHKISGASNNWANGYVV
jgi:tubulin delta